jgi:hypothetical protein
MILHHARCAIARRRSKKKGSPKREDVPQKKKNKDVPPKRDRQKEIGITAKAYSHLLQTGRWQTNKRVRWQPNKQKSPLANKQKSSLAGR